MARLLFALSLVLVAAAARGDEKKDMPGTNVKEGAAPSDAKKEKMLKDIARYAKPVEQHKLLDPLIGKWATNAKLWFGGPKAEQSTRRAEIKSVMGGRFVEEHYD